MHQSNREDEDAIKSVIEEMTEGFNRHDANLATRMYMPDADLVTVRGDRFKGKEAIIRTEEELMSLFSRAGLRLVRITPTASEFFVCETVAA